jgi:hypothetical protein
MVVKASLSYVEASLSFVKDLLSFVKKVLLIVKDPLLIVKDPLLIVKDPLSIVKEVLLIVKTFLTVVEMPSQMVGSGSSGGLLPFRSRTHGNGGLSYKTPSEKAKGSNVHESRRSMRRVMAR